MKEAYDRGVNFTLRRIAQANNGLILLTFMKCEMNRKSYFSTTVPPGCKLLSIVVTRLWADIRVCSGVVRLSVGRLGERVQYLQCKEGHI